MGSSGQAMATVARLMKEVILPSSMLASLLYSPPNYFPQQLKQQQQLESSAPSNQHPHHHQQLLLHSVRFHIILIIFSLSFYFSPLCRKFSIILISLFPACCFSVIDNWSALIELYVIDYCKDILIIQGLAVVVKYVFCLFAVVWSLYRMDFVYSNLLPRQFAVIQVEGFREVESSFVSFNAGLRLFFLY